MKTTTAANNFSLPSSTHSTLRSNIRATSKVSAPYRSCPTSCLIRNSNLFLLKVVGDYGTKEQESVYSAERGLRGEGRALMDLVGFVD
jgi:hypothetical protein